MGVETGVVVAVDAFGKFSTPLTLTEGENRLQAAAGNRAGMSPISAEVLVTLDTTLPVSPSNLAAEAKSGRQRPADLEGPVGDRGHRLQPVSGLGSVYHPARGRQNQHQPDQGHVI